MKRLLRSLARNWYWKLGALTLAILLWFTTVGEPELVTTHNVPVLYKNLQSDLLIGPDTVDAVRVELRGPASKLSASSLSDLALLLNLADVHGSGQKTFTLSDADLHVPPGVTFVRAIPSQLRVTLARRISKQIPVQVEIGTPPPPGYRIAQQQVIPPSVEIAGPEQRVAAITAARTDAIDLHAATPISETAVNVYVADPRVWLESPAMVTVRIALEKNK